MPFGTVLADCGESEVGLGECGAESVRGKVVHQLLTTVLVMKSRFCVMDPVGMTAPGQDSRNRPASSHAADESGAEEVIVFAVESVTDARTSGGQQRSGRSAQIY